MKNVSDKNETHILFSIPFFENRAVYEIMWKNSVRAEQATDKKRRMRIACWKARTQVV